MNTVKIVIIKTFVGILEVMYELECNIKVNPKRGENMGWKNADNTLAKWVMFDLQFFS